jgi:hypothetical protein
VGYSPQSAPDSRDVGDGGLPPSGAGKLEGRSHRMTHAPDDARLRFTFGEHPAPAVRALALPIDGLYREQRRVESIGPSAVCPLRRVQWAARPDVDYVVQVAELAQSLAPPSRRCSRAVVEDAFSLGAYGFVEWSEWEVHVYNEIAPLTPRQLLWASDFTRVTHDRLLAPSDPTA